jgi:hypothetical protein
MHTFKEFLNEIFNNSYKWRWVSKNSEWWEAKFENENSKKINVLFESLSLDSSNYEVTFDTVDNEHPYKLTNEGDEFRIMSTIVDIIRSFFKDNKKVESIVFTAYKEQSSKGNRASLYKKMLKRFASQNNMEFAFDAHNRKTDFILRKIK